jgi:hypothetical protein
MQRTCKVPDITSSVFVWVIKVFGRLKSLAPAFPPRYRVQGTQSSSPVLFLSFAMAWPGNITLVRAPDKMSSMQAWLVPRQRWRPAPTVPGVCIGLWCVRVDLHRRRHHTEDTCAWHQCLQLTYRWCASRADWSTLEHDMCVSLFHTHYASVSIWVWDKCSSSLPALRLLELKMTSEIVFRNLSTV